MANVLLLVFNADNPAADELDIQSVLENAGHTVTLRTAADTEADPDLFDAAVCGTRPGAAALGTNYLGWRKLFVLITQNELNWKNHNFVDANATVTVADHSAIVIVDEGHPLANGLTNGSHTIAGSNEGQAGAPAAAFGSGAEIVAARGGTTNSYTLVAYRAGAAMANNATAAGPRVLIGWRTDLIQAWNATAQGLLVRAVAWGTQLRARVTGAGSVRAALDVRRILAARVAGEGTARAALRVQKRIEAALTGQGTADAALTVEKRLAASVAGGGFVDAALTVESHLATSLVGTGFLSASLRADKPLAAAPFGGGIVRASLTAGAEPTVHSRVLIGSGEPDRIAYAGAPDREAGGPPTRTAAGIV